MKDNADTLVYLAAGAIAAIALGIALMPLREATSAANLAFPFLIEPFAPSAVQAYAWSAAYAAFALACAVTAWQAQRALPLPRERFYSPSAPAVATPAEQATARHRPRRRDAAPQPATQQR